MLNSVQPMELSHGTRRASEEEMLQLSYPARDCQCQCTQGWDIQEFLRRFIVIL